MPPTCFADAASRSAISLAMFNVRRAALSLLLAMASKGGFANLLLSDARLAEAGEDAPLLTALFYGTVERTLTLDYAIAVFAARPADKLSEHTRAVLRLGLYQIYFTRIPPHAAINETVSLGENKGERALVNAVLRRAATEPLPLPPEGRVARYLSVKESFPLATVRRFLAQYGEEDTRALLSAFNRVSPLTVTVNPRVCTREALLADFHSAGFAAEAARYCPRSIRLAGSVDPTSLPRFGEGAFFVQDEASALVADALGAKRGDNVIDVCAAPGGKILGVATALGGEGRFTAFDLHESKLSLIRESAERLGVSLSVRALDATAGDAALDGTADALLCDVPCSGLGVLGKKPDLRYREYDASLSQLGARILERSARYLKAGGVMIYSTCTLAPEENEEVVKEFLNDNQQFTLEEFTLGDGGLKSEGGMLTMLPHRHGTDGFFLAKIKRTL